MTETTSDCRCAVQRLWCLCVALMVTLCWQNKQQRYRCYRAGARMLGYTYRRPLPNCFVWAVRLIWPEPGGVYIGYRS